MRRRSLGRALCLAALLSAVPAAPAGAAATEGAFEFAGRVRTHRLFIPSALPATGVAPLVVVLHGRGRTAAIVEPAFGWDEVAERERFLVLYPEGVGSKWRTVDRPGGPRDGAYLEALIDRVVADHPVDPSRIYVAGMSNGGFMAYALACRLGGRIAAVGSVTGSMPAPCFPERPISVVHVHGTSDRMVPYDGGAGVDENGNLASGPFPAIPAMLAWWRELNACPSARRGRVEGTVVVETWTGCRNGTAVRLHTVVGGGHSWPGARPYGAVDGGVQETQSQTMNATGALWSFFAEHPRTEGPMAVIRRRSGGRRVKPRVATRAQRARRAARR
jgi:polyhydroxybutyrate depolymerase